VRVGEPGMGDLQLWPLLPGTARNGFSVRRPGREDGEKGKEWRESAWP